MEGMNRLEMVFHGVHYFSAANGDLITSLSIRIFRLDFVLKRQPTNLLNSFANNALARKRRKNVTRVPNTVNHSFQTR